MDISGKPKDQVLSEFDIVMRVARAIEAKSNYVVSQHHAKALARAAIEAMRDAGFQYTGDPCWRENVAKALARAMIDPALGGKP